jgi:hypothetical protein
MTWTSNTFSSGEVLTSAKMTLLQNNFRALAFGDSGSPIVTTSAPFPTSVRQGQLYTATASGSTTGSKYTLTGAIWSWWTASSIVSGSPTGGVSFGTGGDLSLSEIGLANAGGSTVYVDERYITGSPPYNLGNGDIPLFVFLTLNNNGEVADIVVAADPPWAHNGPTSIIPERQSAGRAYRHYVVNGSLVELEITQEIKNKDMSLHPHPFDRTRKGVKVLMLDPFGKLVQRLVDVLQESHARESRNILLKYVKFSAMSSDFITPPGVSAIAGVLK